EGAPPAAQLGPCPQAHRHGSIVAETPVAGHPAGTTVRGCGTTTGSGASAFDVLLQRLQALLVDADHHLGHGVVGVDGPRDVRPVPLRGHGDGGLMVFDRHASGDPVDDLAGGVVLASEGLGDVHVHH